MIGQYITKVNNNSFQEEGCSDAIKGINGTKYCVRLERHKQLQFIVTNREHGLIWNVIQEVKVQANDHRTQITSIQHHHVNAVHRQQMSYYEETTKVQL